MYIYRRQKMAHSFSLPGSVTSIINAQPKSALAFINTRVPITVSGSKRTRNRKNDDPWNTLVGRHDSKEYEVHGKCRIMEAKETTHLLCGKSIYEAIRLGGPKDSQDRAELAIDDFRYYAIDPVSMNIRLCIFWFLWAMLVIVIVVSILSYCCMDPKICRNSEKIITLNVTDS